MEHRWGRSLPSRLRAPTLLGRLLKPEHDSEHDGDFAVWWHADDPIDDPAVYPGSESPNAQWRCDHAAILPVETIGEEVRQAVCENCGASGTVKTAAEIAAATARSRDANNANTEKI